MKARRHRLTGYLRGRLWRPIFFVFVGVAPALAGCSSFTSGDGAPPPRPTTLADAFDFSWDRYRSAAPPAQENAAPEPAAVRAAPQPATIAEAPAPMSLSPVDQSQAPPMSVQEALRGGEEWCSLPTDKCDGTHRVQN
jgi:hypothetical protein